MLSPNSANFSISPSKILCFCIISCSNTSPSSSSCSFSTYSSILKSTNPTKLLKLSDSFFGFGFYGGFYVGFVVELLILFLSGKYLNSLGSMTLSYILVNTLLNLVGPEWPLLKFLPK